PASRTLFPYTTLFRSGPVTGGARINRASRAHADPETANVKRTTARCLFHCGPAPMLPPREGPTWLLVVCAACVLRRAGAPVLPPPTGRPPPLPTEPLSGCRPGLRPTPRAVPSSG